MLLRSQCSIAKDGRRWIESEALANSTEGAPGCAEYLESWEPEPIGFIFEENGADPKTGCDGGKGDEWRLHVRGDERVESANRR